MQAIVSNFNIKNKEFIQGSSGLYLYGLDSKAKRSLGGTIMDPRTQRDYE